MTSGRLAMFLVGRYRDRAASDARAWEYQGIFSTHERAVKACLDAGYFIFAVRVDDEITFQKMEVEVEYPLLACQRSNTA